MEKYLIVVDVQRDFVDGALGTAEAVAILPAVKEKISEYVRLGGKIIFTRDTHAEDYLNSTEGKHLPVEHCIRGTDGWQIYNGVYCDGGIIVDKPTFGYLGWENYIESSESLSVELVGLCTDICVVSNALIIKALFPDAEVIVDSSACAGVTPESHNAALQTMRMCQIKVI